MNSSVAFDIDFIPKTPGKTSAVKKRLEQRKQQLESSDEKMCIEQVEDKLTKAQQLRDHKMRVLQDIQVKKNHTVEEIRNKQENQKNILKNKLDQQLQMHEMRRQEQIMKK